MYLASLHVTLDLDPEVARTDRERVLRALRDRVKQVHGSRVSVRTDDDSAVVVALLDDNLERAKARLEEITELLDDAGQARILTSTGQVFAWFEGRFQETAESRAESGEGDDAPDGRAPGGFGNGLGSRPGFTPKERPARTIVYADEDEDEFERGPGLHGRPLAPTSQGLGRRGLRIPTRKP